MTMPFGSFYFAQQLAFVQIPTTHEQRNHLRNFITELWKLRCLVRAHIYSLKNLDRDIDASMYTILLASPQTTKNGPLYTDLETPHLV